ncbi:hypothetical protein NM688_g2221 [Phlebia brevispora]|uniref:Uncharacterized protein n=1 Tax=Phlebia brevispora TaxID=194682 RepID=A0ACC1T9C7_9APHY|nr:hypothetical protein NM688_g2221 [Phlebia brevispora]
MSRSNLHPNPHLPTKVMLHRAVKLVERVFELSSGAWVGVQTSAPRSSPQPSSGESKPITGGGNEELHGHVLQAPQQGVGGEGETHEARDDQVRAAYARRSQFKNAATPISNACGFQVGVSLLEAPRMLQTEIKEAGVDPLKAPAFKTKEGSSGGESDSPVEKSNHIP